MAALLMSYQPTVNGLTSGSVHESREARPEDMEALLYSLDSFSPTGHVRFVQAGAVLIAHGPAVQVPTLTPAPVREMASLGDRLAELKARTALTWEQIARLFGVSKRAVMLWNAGGRMSSIHEERLAELLVRVQRFDGDNAQQVRTRLLSDNRNGRTPYQQWVQEVSSPRPGDAWIDRQPHPQ